MIQVVFALVIAVVVLITALLFWWLYPTAANETDIITVGDTPSSVEKRVWPWWIVVISLLSFVIVILLIARYYTVNNKQTQYKPDEVTEEVQRAGYTLMYTLFGDDETNKLIKKIKKREADFGNLPKVIITEAQQKLAIEKFKRGIEGAKNLQGFDPRENHSLEIAIAMLKTRAPAHEIAYIASI